MVELFAAGCGPPVGAKAWFGAPAKGEGNVRGQIVLPASVSGVPLRAASTVEVVSTLAVGSFTVA